MLVTTGDVKKEPMGVWETTHYNIIPTGVKMIIIINVSPFCSQQNPTVPPFSGFFIGLWTLYMRKKGLWCRIKGLIPVQLLPFLPFSCNENVHKFRVERGFQKMMTNWGIFCWGVNPLPEDHILCSKGFFFNPMRPAQLPEGGVKGGLHTWHNEGGHRVEGHEPVWTGLVYPSFISSRVLLLPLPSTFRGFHNN